MKLYVCWDNREKHPLIGTHPCGVAYQALVDAGYEPEVKRAYGWNKLPETPFNKTPGRQEVKRLTGSLDVPVLVLDDGTAIGGTREITDWAKANPAAAAA